MYGLSNIFSSPIYNKSIINVMYSLLLIVLEGLVVYDTLLPIGLEVGIKVGSDDGFDQPPMYNFIMFQSILDKKRVNHCINTNILCNWYKIILLFPNVITMVVKIVILTQNGSNF